MMLVLLRVLFTLENKKMSVHAKNVEPTAFKMLAKRFEISATRPGGFQ